MGKKKNYSCYEYSNEERSVLEGLYDKSIGPNIPYSGKEFGNGSTVRVRVDCNKNGVGVF